MKYLLFILLLACSNQIIDAKQTAPPGNCPEPWFSKKRIKSQMVTVDKTNNYGKTGLNAEHVSVLNAWAQSKHKDRIKVVYSIRLVNLAPGDIIIFNGQGEVTNESYGPEIGFFLGWGMVLGQTPYSVEGINLIKRKGYNLSRNMHHGVFISNFSLVVKDNNISWG